MVKYRIEEDFLGEIKVPADAYYGIQSIRAAQNFPVTGHKMDQEYIKAVALVKRAAAEANMSVGQLEGKIGEAIVKAAQTLMDGDRELIESVLVDPIQGGAGTSLNMNINEIIANKAIELLKGEKGDYELISPNSHVNMSQSTNDVIPTALRVATLKKIEGLVSVLDELYAAFKEKEKEFDHCLKIGRTHLQDAIPIRLGQEFGAYAAAVNRSRERIITASKSLNNINMGATAVGTGLNADPNYIKIVARKIKQLSGLDLESADNLVDATQNADVFIEVSSALKALAVTLSKVANDLRLMASGPQCGLKEIFLPEVQPGSSIMPGKVNPVMPELLNQVNFQVVGNDLTINWAVEAGQFELNVMMPVIAFNLLQSINILSNSVAVFTEKCLRGITANEDKCRENVEKSICIVTALNPHIGYEQASSVAREAEESGKTVKEVVLSQGLLTAEQLDKILSPLEMTEPGIAGKELFDSQNTSFAR